LKSKIQKIKSRQIELVFLIVVYFWRRWMKSEDVIFLLCAFESNTISWLFFHVILFLVYSLNRIVFCLVCLFVCYVSFKNEMNDWFLCFPIFTICIVSSWLHFC
jgi:hypothetical protein